MDSFSLSVLIALVLSIAMIVVAVLTWFYHDTKHRDLDDWIDYGFSRTTLRHALLYYQSMGISMLFFYVLFTANCLWLQWDGYVLFTDGAAPVSVGLFGTLFFAADLVLRGGFFDVMEHFNLSVSTVYMNRGSYWFVLYCFVFRIYYGLTLIRIALSFVWIWMKMRSAHKTNFADRQG